jgi:hypothetical protein
MATRTKRVFALLLGLNLLVILVGLGITLATPDEVVTGWVLKPQQRTVSVVVESVSYPDPPSKPSDQRVVQVRFFIDMPNGELSYRILTFGPPVDTTDNRPKTPEIVNNHLTVHQRLDTGETSATPWPGLDDKWVEVTVQHGVHTVGQWMLIVGIPVMFIVGLIWLLERPPNPTS